jgi:2-polyprenyl-3-methyl-5-hydroxy-6-metoxy-1,4-benzoquinol methylase
VKDHLFYRDGQKIDIREWNQAVNRLNPMSTKLHHPFFPIRYLERRRRRILMDQVPVNGYSRGADIGCESGHLAFSMAGRGGRLTAVDMDPSVAAEAARSSPCPARISFVCSDVSALALKNGLFDFCLCAETLEHVPDMEKALEEIVRVTRPGGRLVLAVPNERRILFLKRAMTRLGLGGLLGNLSRGQAMGHLRSLSRKDLLDLIPDNVRVLKAFYDRPFGMNLFVVAEVT